MAVVGVVTAVSSMFSHLQLSMLAKQVEDDQATNIKVLQDHEHRLAMDERSIRILNYTYTHLYYKVQDNKYHVKFIEQLMNLDWTLDALSRDSTRLIRGLNGLAEHRLTPDLVNTTAMVAALLYQKERMLAEDYELGIGQLDDLYRCPTSHVVFENGQLLVLVHIPMFQKETRMRLLEYVPLPTFVEYNQSLSTWETWTTSNPPTQKKIVFKVVPPQALIAMTDDERTFKIMTRAELDDCQMLANVYFCHNSNWYDKRSRSSCIAGLYLKDSAVIKKFCPLHKQPQEDVAIQITSRGFLIYLHDHQRLKQVCKDPDATHPQEVVEIDVFGPLELTLSRVYRPYPLV
jgi:hypothetical protein